MKVVKRSILTRGVSPIEVSDAEELLKQHFRNGNEIQLTRRNAKILFLELTKYQGKTKGLHGRSIIIVESLKRKSSKHIALFVEVIALLISKWRTGETLNTSRFDNYRPFIEAQIGPIPNLTRDESQYIGVFRELLRRSGQKVA